MFSYPSGVIIRPFYSSFTPKICRNLFVFQPTERLCKAANKSPSSSRPNYQDVTSLQLFGYKQNPRDQEQSSALFPPYCSCLLLCIVLTFSRRVLSPGGSASYVTIAACTREHDFNLLLGLIVVSLLCNHLQHYWSSKNANEPRAIASKVLSGHAKI